MQRPIVYFLTGVVLTSILLLTVTAFRWNYFLHQALSISASGTVFNLAAGETLTSTAATLHKEGLMPHPRVWSTYAKLRGLDDKIKAGEYFIASGTTPVELLTQLVDGRVIQKVFMVVEGQTYQDMRTLLTRLEGVEQLLPGMSDEEIMQELGLVGKHPEGYFFPDSYNYGKMTSDLDLLKRSNQRMLHILYDSWSRRQRDLPFRTPYEALIAASIIEKESALESERPLIAGVLINRLKKRMRLQVDPTVIYGIGPDFDGNITRKHLRQDTPYNTYLNLGLPPTPISLPSRSSIHAALNPESTQALYFVAKGDGSHHFSSELSEHNKAVDALIRRNSSSGILPKNKQEAPELISSEESS